MISPWSGRSPPLFNIRFPPRPYPIIYGRPRPTHPDLHLVLLRPTSTLLFPCKQFHPNSWSPFYGLYDYPTNNHRIFFTKQRYLLYLYDLTDLLTLPSLTFKVSWLVRSYPVDILWPFEWSIQGDQWFHFSLRDPHRLPPMVLMTLHDISEIEIRPRLSSSTIRSWSEGPQLLLLTRTLSSPVHHWELVVFVPPILMTLSVVITLLWVPPDWICIVTFTDYPV